MQQTEKYKLNLIEPTDPFLPEALNQNTQKIEDAMTAHEEGIEQRLTVLEARHFAYGTYVGTYVPSQPQCVSQFIPLPFKPKVVLTRPATGDSSDQYSAFSTDLEGGENTYLQLLDNGFLVKYYVNNAGLNHNFIAFG